MSLRIHNVDRLLYSAGAFAFQEATIISTSESNLTLNPAGGVGLGSAPGANTYFRINGSVSASGNLAFGVLVDPTLTAAANGDLLIPMHMQSATIATGSYTGLNSYYLNIVGSGLSKTGSGTVDTAAALRIQDAPSLGTVNYALLVAAGTSRFDGDILVGAGADQGSVVSVLNTITPAVYSGGTETPRPSRLTLVARL